MQLPINLGLTQSHKVRKKTLNAGRELHSLNSETNLGTKPAFQPLPLRLSVLRVRLVLHRSGLEIRKPMDEGCPNPNDAVR